MTSSNTNIKNNNQTITSVLTTTTILFTSSIVTYLTYNHIKRKQQSRWLEIEEQIYETLDNEKNKALALTLASKEEEEKEKVEESVEIAKDAIPSIIAHFQSLTINNPNTTIEEANKRRTQSYYEKMRDGHLQNLVLGEGTGYRYNFLISKRQKEMNRIMRYYKKGNQSHRTVVVMCDEYTSKILQEAKELILKPLNYNMDINTEHVWIPFENLIPSEDMHVTVALPWWWHTMRQENNQELSEKLCSRFRQAILKGMHHPFQIELERIVLLGGKTLVALWRTVGERRQSSSGGGSIICDRHGDGIDPFVRLRREVADCFTQENLDIGNEPLTYTHNKINTNTSSSSVPLIYPPRPDKVIRQNTIESKTPGLHSKDGFIHTTLCRLPLHCLSSHDVNLAHVHRLCREATATYCGHRMNVDAFRFLETTGEGGESNPCYKPVFDELVDAPLKYNTNHLDLNHSTNTIGAVVGDASQRSSVFELFNMDRNAHIVKEEEENENDTIIQPDEVKHKEEEKDENVVIIEKLEDEEHKLKKYDVVKEEEGVSKDVEEEDEDMFFDTITYNSIRNLKETEVIEMD